MDKDLILRINESQNVGADEPMNAVYDIYNELIQRYDGVIPRDVIRDIFQSDGRYFKIHFMELYDNLSEEDIALIAAYVIEGLNDSDKRYVSALIDFALDWNVNLPYAPLLKFLNDVTEDGFSLLLSTLDYITEHVNGVYAVQLYDQLDQIINNPEYYMVAQIRALFLLFWLTHKREHLADLIEFVVSGGHKKLMASILSAPDRSQKYFEYHDFILTACGIKEGTDLID